MTFKWIYKKVLSDGFLVINLINFCHKLRDVKAALRSEILRTFDEYSAFSSDKISVLTKLHRYSANPLQYYNFNTVDRFLIRGRRTAFVCGTATEVRKKEQSESNAAGFFLQFDFLNG